MRDGRLRRARRADAGERPSGEPPKLQRGGGEGPGRRAQAAASQAHAPRRREEPLRGSVRQAGGGDGGPRGGRRGAHGRQGELVDLRGPTRREERG